MMESTLDRQTQPGTATAWRRRALCVAAAVVFGPFAPAHADVMYNTFGPGDSYNTTNFWENGPFGTLGGFTAMPFELDPGEFTDIAITLPVAQSVNGDPGEFMFQVRIYADDGVPTNAAKYPGETTPGTLIASIDGVASDLPAVQPGGVALTTFDFGSLTLDGNARYWVAIEPTMDSALLFSYISWYINDLGVDGYKAQRSALFPYNDFPDDWGLLGPGEGGAHGAMRISGTLVPAPSCLTLLLVSAFATRRHRRA